MADYFIDSSGLRDLLRQGLLPANPLLEVAKAKLLGTSIACKACQRAPASVVAVDTLMAAALDSMSRSNGEGLRRAILSAEAQTLDKTVEMAVAGRNIRIAPRTFA